MEKEKRAAELTEQGTEQAESQELLELLGMGKKNRKKPGWKLWAILGAAALLAGGAALFFTLTGNEEADGQSVYREYTVERGDIVVGQSESSSISLNRESVTFPVSAAVEEVYVKEGSSVKAGDELVKLSVSDIQTGLASYELQLEMAGLQLEQAKLQQQTRLLQAEQQLESSEEAGELAGTEKSLTLSSLEQDLVNAKLQLENAQQEYNDYASMYTSFGRDYQSVVNLQAEVTRLENLELDYESQIDQLAEYKALLAEAEAQRDRVLNANSPISSGASDILTILGEYKTLMDNAYQAERTAAAAYTQAENALAADPGNENLQNDRDNAYVAWLAAKEDYTVKKSNYDTLYAAFNELDPILDAIALYESKIAAMNESVLEANLSSTRTALSAAQTAYNTADTNFKAVYGSITELSDIVERLESAQEAVADAELALGRTELSVTTGATEAEHQAETALNEAEVAGATYELTVLELSQAVEEAQEEYDALESQIEEIKSIIPEDGVVRAEVNGLVASVNVEAGDEITVIVDSDTNQIMAYAQLLTMTDIENVYVPITISEEDILSVSIGQSAQVTMNSFPNRTFDAEVDTITVESSRSGAATVSYTVNVRFAEANTLEMLEGMSAEVTLISRIANDVLYINNTCVSFENGASTVLVRNAAGEAESRAVKTGFSDGRYVEILEGLSEGEVVLAESAVSRG